MTKTDSDIKMVFLDIDGTLYAQGELVPKSVAAVASLLGANVPVAICTGRSVLHAQHIQDALQVPYGIYFNGGLVKTDSKELFSTPFDSDDVQAILDYASENHIPTIVHTHKRALSAKPIPREFDPVLRSFDFPNIDIQENLTSSVKDIEVFQINAFMTKEWDATFEQKFTTSYIYRWNPNAVDFQRRKSDKSIGALHLLKHLGISPEHAVHIGDGGNDIGMFRALGHSFAMGNASEDVKLAAKRITTSAVDGGVADALKELGLV